MTCDEVQSLLLQFDEDDGFNAPDGVFERAVSHAAGCAACGDLVRKLRRLKDAVRSLPEPSDREMLEARLRFERQYSEKLRGSDGAAASRRSRWIGAPARWAVVAAAILLAVGGGSLAYLHHQQSQSRMIASSETTIDQGVGLNLSLSEAESEAERKQLFVAGSQDYQHRIDAGELRGDDREFADKLLQGAKLLTVTNDPLTQADHFTHVADLLVTRMDNAARRNPKALAHLGQAYLNVANRGIHRNLDLAAASELTPEARHRLQKLVQRNLLLQTRLQAVLRDNPDQIQVRKQLEQIDHRLRRLEQKLNATTQPIPPKHNPIR